MLLVAMHLLLGAFPSPFLVTASPSCIPIASRSVLHLVQREDRLQVNVIESSSGRDDLEH